MYRLSNDRSLKSRDELAARVYDVPSDIILSSHAVKSVIGGGYPLHGFHPIVIACVPSGN